MDPVTSTPYRSHAVRMTGVALLVVAVLGLAAVVALGSLAGAWDPVLVGVAVVALAAAVLVVRRDQRLGVPRGAARRRG